MVKQSDPARTLTEEHQAHLLACALTQDQLATIGYWSDHRGRLHIPYLQPDGSPEVTHSGAPFARFRLSAAEAVADPKGGKYRSPAGEGCRLYHSPLAIARGGYPERLANVRIPLRITEGEHKVNAATAHDPARLTIGIGGVNAWRDRYDSSDPAAPSRPLVDLEALPLDGREVRLCFDSDLHKPQVRAALRELAAWLKSRGARVILEVLPNAPVRDTAGKVQRLGLDDLIHRYGAPFFLRIAEHSRLAEFGEDHQLVIPGEPSGKTATFYRALWLHGLLGSQWRADHESGAAWLQWAGTHWRPIDGPGPLGEAIEEFMDCQGWKAARAVGAVNDLMAAFRRMVGELPPADLRGLVPCRNGVLRVADGALLPHDPTRGNRWALPFDWAPQVDPGPIRSFLLEALGGEEDVALFRAFAQSAALGIRRKLFLEVTGPADSGKSVVASLLTALVGLRNTCAMSLDRLEAPDARFETLRLRGKRLAIFSEAQRYAGPLETLKALTGGDLIRAERKGSNALCDFYFDGAVLVIGNAPIRPADTSAAAINRRRSLITPRAVPPAQQRPLLDRRGEEWEGELAPHLPGLLAWALAMPEDEARRALSRDVATPARMEAELVALVESDPLAAWADEALVFDPQAVGLDAARVGTTESSPDLYLLPHYRRAVQVDGGQPLSGKNFKAKLVGLLRDSLGLALPDGPVSTGSYRDRTRGSLVPCIRFRTDADGEAPGVIRHAMQARMCPAEHESPRTLAGDGSDESVMAARWQEPSQGTDVMDVMDKRPHSSHAGAGARAHGGVCGDLPVSSITSVPAQGSIHHACRPHPSRTRHAPADPKHLKVDDPVEVLQSDGSWRNGYRVTSQPKDGRVQVSSATGSLLRPLDQVRLCLAL